MLPDNLFVNLVTKDLHEQVKQATQSDEFATNIIKCLMEKSPPPLWTALSNWTNDNGIILYKGKSYIPENTELRHSIIKEYHESPTSGHPGFFKMLVLLKENYWWPGMTILLKKYIEGCTICQQMKPNTHPTAAPLMPISSHAHCPFQQVTMDFITNLPVSDGFDSIFIVVDQGLTKGVMLCPCNKNITSLQTADLLFVNEIFKHFGLPDSMISDRGPQFSAKVFKDITHNLFIKHKMSTASHPQTDGHSLTINIPMKN